MTESDRGFEPDSHRIVATVTPRQERNVVDLDDERVSFGFISESDTGEIGSVVYIRNVRDIDVDTLRFGAPDAVNAGDGATAVSSDVRNINDEAGDDLLVKFPTDNTGFDGNETTARIRGRTSDGAEIAATVPVTVQS